MTRRAVLLLSLAVTLLAAPPALDPAKAGMDAERLSRIAERMKAFIAKGTIPGAVTLIQRHGALAHLETVGYMDLEAKKPMRADTIFQIMSMTKPVTAAAVMILMEEGRLGLDDAVEKHLPEFKGQMVIESRDGDRMILKKPSRPITIRDLLTHTSGLNPPRANLGGAEMPFWMRKTLAEAVALYSQAPLAFEPGTKWQYSNAGIATLGRIIEVASDQPYEQFLASRIFQPLGMTDTYVFPPQEKWDRIATVYTFTDGKLKPAGPDTLGGGDWKYRKGAKYPLPEGGLYSTATDLAAFYQAMLSGGIYNGKRILSKPTIDIMTAVHTGELTAGHQTGMGYGLAWSVVKDVQGTLALPLLSVGTYHHGGAFGTHGWVDPKRDLVGVFLVQRPGANDERNAFMALAGSAIRD